MSSLEIKTSNFYKKMPAKNRTVKRRDQTPQSLPALQSREEEEEPEDPSTPTSTPASTSASTPASTPASTSASTQARQDSDKEEEVALLRERRKKGSEEWRHFFRPAVEDDFIKWWRDHEFLYNNTLPGFMYKMKKELLIAAKAKAKAIGCTSQYWEIMFG